MNNDELHVLDNHPLNGNSLVEVRYGYVYWMRLCLSIVLLVALGGGLFSGYLFFWFYSDGPRSMAPTRMYNIYLLLGGLTITGVLLTLGCYRTWVYSQKLDSVNFLNPIEAERWHEAAQQGYKLWRTCAVAIVMLIIALGPFLSYEGYVALKREYEWRNYTSGVEAEEALQEIISE